MRILRVAVTTWRNFRNVEIVVPQDATLVCLVGENGTGKSNILELISAAANLLGISPGIENPRGIPFSEVHDVQLDVRFGWDMFERLPADRQLHYRENGIAWDGIIRLSSSRTAEGAMHQLMVAGGSGDQGLRTTLAAELRDVLSADKETNYLSLDADRSYPPMQVHPQHYAEALDRDWESAQWQKNRAFVPTRAMYDEWLQYFLAKESQDATKHFQAERRAAEGAGVRPAFIDGFQSYKAALQKVLPHLRFLGVDSQKKTLVYDSSGLELRFTNLSGGEREISFIIGQIERFKLRRGFLLIDEPELHLNPDLLRTWVAYLRDTIETGQVWISTHSLEAVETAGTDSSFVLERTQDTRLVERISPLSDRPVLAVLSAAVGSPAFSLRNIKFIHIEGDRQGRERDRFFQLYLDDRFVRFIEVGGCNEVNRKLKAITELAEYADEQLVVGGVIDRDFRTSEEVNDLSQRVNLHVLGVHEVENFFLQPAAIQVIARRSGVQQDANDIIKRCSDRFAGSWVLNSAFSDAGERRDLTADLRKLASELRWELIAGDENAAVQQLLAANTTCFPDLDDRLRSSIGAYQQLRDGHQLWKFCLGKEVLGVLPKEIGLQSVKALERNVLSCWADELSPIPEELTALRLYIDELGPPMARTP